MPWTAANATEHSKRADTPRKKKQWATVANKVLRETKNEGRAVRTANAAVGDRFWDGDHFMRDSFKQYLDRKKVTRYDPKGREEGTWEEEEDCDETKDASPRYRCDECDGKGLVHGKECEACGGDGFVDEDEKLRRQSAFEGRSSKKDSVTDNEPKPPPIVSGGVTTMSEVHMRDTIELDDAAQVRVLENGYVAAMPRIARTGIQVYRGSECGVEDMDLVRVYRPQEAVFATDSVHSYTHLPVTLEHPSETVDASNWKKYAVGETGDEVLRDGGSVRVPMMLRDADAIKAFRAGKNQLSVGYDCNVELRSGVTEDGEEYDAVQSGIRANHLAVVAAARGGPSLKIGDAERDSKGETTMNLKTILVDGLEVQVLDSAATSIQRALSSYETRLQDAFKKLKEKEEEEEENEEEVAKKDSALKAKDAAIKEKDKALETKDGEISALKSQIADLEKKCSPAAIDSASRERAAVIQKARNLVGDKLKTDSMTIPEIRRAVVDARIGDCRDWSDDRVDGAFTALQGNAFADHGRQLPNTIDAAVSVFGRPGAGYQTPSEMRDQAYSDYDRDLQSAYRNAKQT